MSSSINIQSLLQTASQIVSDIHIADEEKKRAIKLFNDSKKVDQDLFEEVIKVTKQCYLIDTAKELKQHAQQLDADYIYNLKESERDMFDQKNQQYQTVIVSASVMFSALSTVIIQGILPNNSTNLIFIAYSLTTSLSFGSLFLSIVICIEVISNASSFMFYKSSKLSEELRRINEVGPESDMQAMLEKVMSIDKKDFDNVWQNHEKYLKEKLKKRDENNDVLALRNLSVDNNHRNYYNNDGIVLLFSDYFDENLKVWGQIGERLFYGGTYNLLLSIIIYMFSKFYLAYNSVAGASISVGLIGTSIFVGIILIDLNQVKGKIRTYIENCDFTFIKNCLSISKFCIAFRSMFHNNQIHDKVIYFIIYIVIAASAIFTIVSIVLLGTTQSAGYST